MRGLGRPLSMLALVATELRAGCALARGEVAAVCRLQAEEAASLAQERAREFLSVLIWPHRSEKGMVVRALERLHYVSDEVEASDEVAEKGDTTHDARREKAQEEVAQLSAGAQNLVGYGGVETGMMVQSYMLVRRLDLEPSLEQVTQAKSTEKKWFPRLSYAENVLDVGWKDWPVVLRVDRTEEELALSEVHAEEYESVWKKCVRNSQRLKEAAREGENGFGKYHLGERFDVGGQGEVWEAVQVVNLDDSGTFASDMVETVFVLKRVFQERGEKYYLSGLREIVFGQRLQGFPEIAQFVEAFNETVPSNDGVEDGKKDLWLVFQHEGKSLDSLLYSRVRLEDTVLVEPSVLWQRMRRDYDGSLVRREILRQILEGLCVVHRNRIAHRDIKPKNLLIKEAESNETKWSGQEDKGWRKGGGASRSDFRLKIADFGSAVDTEDNLLNAKLYGRDGPTAEEETTRYRPPEAFLGGVTSMRFPYLGNDLSSLNIPENELPYHAYDMWSVGVIALELLLGTCEVFELDARSRARVDLEVKRTKYLYADEEAEAAVKEMRYNLKALENFGITPAGLNKSRFNETVKRMDPFGRGFFSPMGLSRGSHSQGDLLLFAENELDLVTRLLAFSPWERITAEQALEHAYFSL